MTQSASGEPNSPVRLSVEVNSRINEFVRLLKAYTVLGTLSVIWGLAFVAIKATEPLLTPANLTLLRGFLQVWAFLHWLPFWAG